MTPGRTAGEARVLPWLDIGLFPEPDPNCTRRCTMNLADEGVPRQNGRTMISDGLRSILLGQSALYVLMCVALLLTFTREPRAGPGHVHGLARTFLLCLSLQCVHLIEEFVTGFHVELPRLLGLVPWSAEFFLSFNIVWLAVWIVAAVGIEARVRLALFPIWFFALGMVANAIWHPLLAVAKGGYFPGLLTSPVVGAAGVLVLRGLWRLSAPPPQPADLHTA